MARQRVGSSRVSECARILRELERKQGGSGRFGSRHTVGNRSEYRRALDEAGIWRAPEARHQLGRQGTGRWGGGGAEARASAPENTRHCVGSFRAECARILRELERERGGDRRSTRQRVGLVSEYRRALDEAGMSERTARRLPSTHKARA